MNESNELRDPQYLDAGETYGSFEEFKEQILYKRIVKWDDDMLTLDDGTVMYIVCSEQDCCSSAGGEFTNVELDAVITDVLPPEDVPEEEDDYCTNRVTLKIFHNQNVIAQANMKADCGDSGYYYSVGSIQIDKVHYEMVSA